MLNPSRLVACVVVGFVAGSFGCACPPTGDRGVNIDVELRIMVVDTEYLDEVGLDTDAIPFDLGAGGFERLSDVGADLIIRAMQANRRAWLAASPRVTLSDSGAAQVWIGFQISGPLNEDFVYPPSAYDVYARRAEDGSSVDVAIRVVESSDGRVEQPVVAEVERRLACELSRIPRGVHDDPMRGRASIANGGTAMFVPPTKINLGSPEHPGLRTLMVLVKPTILDATPRRLPDRNDPR